MKARVVFAGALGALVLAVASPVAAKVAIVEAHIVGPGLGRGGLRISGPATEGMWESGIDLAGGLDDARADSIAELGLAAGDLGPRYTVRYRFHHQPTRAKLVRQDLYPYAAGGPVTFTPPRQHVDEGQPWGGEISAGWFRGSSAFLRYLVRQGVPERSPVTEAAGRASAPAAEPATRSTRVGVAWIPVGLAGLVVLWFVFARSRRRVVSAPGPSSVGGRDAHPGRADA